MHILASHIRSEFLACPQLVRLDFAQGLYGAEPTLLIKGSTLLLKYIVLGARMQFAFAKLDDRLLYGLKIYDDTQKPALLWSVLERKEEKRALISLARGKNCETFLFNEIAVNVAQSSLVVDFAGADVTALVQDAVTGQADHDELKRSNSTILDRLHNASQSAHGIVVANVSNSAQWTPLKNTLITNSATASLIDLFDTDEGKQQEQIGVWLTDNLHPTGAYYSPQVPKGKQTRELTDILLTYQFGSFLIESKALSLFARDNLPNRDKLASDVSKHVAKAVSQLRGGIKNLKTGTSVTTLAGDAIVVERTQPAHAIILIPDMDLIQDPSVYGIDFMRAFSKASSGFLHLLDTSELLRIVQAAGKIAETTNVTQMMAFDFYLMERTKKAIECGTLCFEMLFRIPNEGVHII
jgi:hypothetical protein